MVSPFKSDPCEQSPMRLQGGDGGRRAALRTLATAVMQCTAWSTVQAIPGGQNLNRCF